jgi:hypothetical protein
MGELHESLGGTINYYGELWATLSKLWATLGVLQNYIKTPFYSFLGD